MDKHNKTFVTFGQVHKHILADKVFDKDCICIIESTSYDEGRKIAEEAFGKVFCTTYFADNWNEDDMKFYPRGYIQL